LTDPNLYNGKADDPKTAVLLRPSYGAPTPMCEKSVHQAIQFTDDYTPHKLFCMEPRTGHQLVVRNMCIKDALKTCPDAKKLILIDTDTVIAPDAFCRLLAHDVDIVGALFVRDGHLGNGGKSHGYLPTFLKYVPGTDHIYAPYGGPFDSKLHGGEFGCRYLVGMGLTVIDRKVLEKIKPPWFACPPLGDSAMRPDTYFCEKAQDLGFKIYCDLSVWTGHEKLQVLTLAHFAPVLVDHMNDRKPRIVEGAEYWMDYYKRLKEHQNNAIGAKQGDSRREVAIAR